MSNTDFLQLYMPDMAAAISAMAAVNAAQTAAANDAADLFSRILDWMVQVRQKTPRWDGMMMAGYVFETPFDEILRAFPEFQPCTPLSGECTFILALKAGASYTPGKKWWQLRASRPVVTPPSGYLQLQIPVMGGVWAITVSLVGGERPKLSIDFNLQPNPYDDISIYPPQNYHYAWANTGHIEFFASLTNPIIS